MDLALNARLFETLTPVAPHYKMKRSGLLGKKMGMTQFWDKWGVRHALTIIQVDRCQVTQIKTPERDGYSGLQLGAFIIFLILGIGQKNLKRLKKSEIGHYLKHDLPPSYRLMEFRVSEENILPVGFLISARHFCPG